jgi:hypothetical protein
MENPAYGSGILIFKKKYILALLGSGCITKSPLVGCPSIRKL